MGMMTPDQFEHALSLTRCRGRAAEAARLHFVDGLSLTDAAATVGVTLQTVSRTVETVKSKIEGVKMSAKKLGIYLADDSLSFLEIIQSQHGEDEMNLSSAVNLCIQLGKLITEAPLPLTTGELLLCCDVLNGGANLCEVDTPDSASIERALDSMKFGLMDARYHEHGIFEKWVVNERDFYAHIQSLSTSDLFALAIATRQFWSKLTVAGRKPVQEIGDYWEWASQWCGN